MLTPYHKGPVGAAAHHFTLSDAMLLSDGGVRFAVYVDGGTPAVPAHIMKVEVVGPDGGALATWDWRALSALAPTAIVNDFAYNRFKPAAYGLEAGVGAKAIVTLPPPADAYETRAGAEVRVTDVNGRTSSPKPAAGLTAETPRGLRPPRPRPTIRAGQPLSTCPLKRRRRAGRHDDEVLAPMLRKACGLRLSNK